VALAVNLDEVGPHLCKKCIYHLCGQRSAGIGYFFTCMQIEMNPEETIGSFQYCGGPACLRQACNTGKYQQKHNCQGSLVHFVHYSGLDCDTGETVSIISFMQDTY
jgi:hypothetical protein